MPASPRTCQSKFMYVVFGFYAQIYCHLVAINRSFSSLFVSELVLFTCELCLKFMFESNDNNKFLIYPTFVYVVFLAVCKDSFVLCHLCFGKPELQQQSFIYADININELHQPLELNSRWRQLRPHFRF